VVDLKREAGRPVGGEDMDMDVTTSCRIDDDQAAKKKAKMRIEIVHKKKHYLNQH